MRVRVRVWGWVRDWVRVSRVLIDDIDVFALELAVRVRVRVRGRVRVRVRG